MTKKIKHFLQQAEVYRKQGLLNEARKKYEQVNEIIEGSDNLPNKQKLLDGLAKKLAILTEEIKAVENAPPTPEMSNHVNDLIKKLFSFANQEKDENDAALEGAIALAKFGQFEGAIDEFHKLLEVESQRVAAGKNILRCYLEGDSPGDAAKKVAEWQGGDIFSPEQLDIILNFYDNLLEKKGLKKDDLPEAPDLETEPEAVEEPHPGKPHPGKPRLGKPRQGHQTLSIQNRTRATMNFWTSAPWRSHSTAARTRANRLSSMSVSNPATSSV